MKIALYGASALQFWRASVISSKRISARCTLPEGFVTSLTKSEYSYMENRFGLAAPVDAIASSDISRRCNKILSGHVDAQAIDAGRLVHVCKNLFVASPEQTMIQLAAQLSLVQFPHIANMASREILLALVMCELAGRYRLNPNSGDGFREAAPVLNLAKLADSICGQERQRGAAQLKQAMKHALPNSNSPAETQLALFETLPKPWGGEGMAAPLLNFEVKTRVRAVARPRFGDQCWPDAHRIVEYNGGYHEGERANDDDARRNALIAQGYTVNVVNKDQLHDADALADLLADVAGAVGTYGRRPKDFARRRAEMRSLVFEASGTKCWENHGDLVPEFIKARPYTLPGTDSSAEGATGAATNSAATNSAATSSANANTIDAA